jgi:DNA-binding transcriptional regulator YdaS (Cro superfamily)
MVNLVALSAKNSQASRIPSRPGSLIEKATTGSVWSEMLHPNGELLDQVQNVDQVSLQT